MLSAARGWFPRFALAGLGCGLGIWCTAQVMGWEEPASAGDEPPASRPVVKGKNAPAPTGELLTLARFPAPTYPPAGTIIQNSIGMKLASVPSGEFKMGSPMREVDRGDDEQLHLVRITQPMLVGVYEVTQAEFEEVFGENLSYFCPEGDGADLVAGKDAKRFPAECVSWLDGIDFCKKLSALPKEVEAKRVYRLPTEAEWEYCCRAGTQTEFHYGRKLTSDLANMDGLWPYGVEEKGTKLGRPTTVGSFQPNAFGLYDMHGNVWEWCLDCYNAEYYDESPRDNPQGPDMGPVLCGGRVVRGGGWDEPGRICRSASRSGVAHSHRGKHFGFRVICTLKE